MRGDRAVELAAEKLEALARKAAAKGGLVGKAANELAEDAAFLRKLKPSLIAARAKGEVPHDGSASAPTAVRPIALPEPRLERPARKGGPNPFAVAGAAFGIGTLLAKAIDWRSHAHPRR
jgi:hypothetical protein